MRATHLLRTFTPTGIQILAGIAQEKSFPAGTPLFVENMLGEGLYVIGSGRIRISVRGRDGRDVPLAILGPGETLGEAALLRSGPRMCTATAEDDCVVFEISRRDIAVLQKQKPQACLKLTIVIVDALGDRMRGSDQELRAFVAWRAGRAG